jgi:hypothetical protein
MNKFISILILILIFVSLYFSYRTRGYRFEIFDDDFLESELVENINIINRPIVFDAQRKFLTGLYRQKHTGDCDPDTDGIDTCILIEPKIIVVHMTDIDSFEKSFEYMKEPVLREEREKLISRSYDRVNVSTHYLIDKLGNIYSLMPDNYMGRHAMGVNHSSIGIENVGMNANPPSREQVEANLKLIKYLMKKYDIKASDVYSHAETALLKEKGEPIFIEKDKNYLIQKNCGQKLIKEIRKRLTEKNI